MFSRTFGLVWWLLVCAVNAWAQIPRTCAVATPLVPTVRSLGVAETVGDLVITCNAAAQTAGSALPQANVSVTLSAASGNRVFVGGYTDAILLVGEPNEANQFPCTLDACAGTTGAALGNGPLENRNVFAGRLTGVNTISWTVPLDGNQQVMRIVNLRVNASTLAGQGTNLAAPAVGATVAVSSATVGNPAVTVATLNPGIDFAVRSSDANTVVRLDRNTVTNSPVGENSDFQFSLRFVETTPFAWRNRSVTSGAADPTRVQTQSRPGQAAESRFLLSETGYYNQAFPALNGLSAAGLGDSGTRILARFGNIPAGVRVFVSTSPLADFTSGVTARLITTDTNGVGFFSATPPTAFIRGGTVGVAELPVSEGRATAVWEVLDPSVELDRLSFGGLLSYGVPVADATVTVQGMLGPVSPTGTVSTAPRFAVLNSVTSAAIIGAGGGVVVPPPGGGGGGGLFAVASPEALPAAIAGQSYTYTLAANPPSAGLVWSVIEGTFPPGMTFGSNGVLAGAPAFPGTYSFTVRVQNLAGQVATARLAIFVRASQLTVAPVGIVNGTVGTSLTPVSLAATGGAGPLRWFAQTDRIPPGLTLTENGIISGVPSVEGLYSLPVFAQDATGTTAQTVATFSVVGFLRVVTPSPLPAVPPGLAYRVPLEAAGGTTPYRWSLVSGSLPFGLALDNTGAISGGTVVPGRGAFVLQVTDGAGRTARRSYTVELVGNGVGLNRVRVQPEGLRLAGALPQLLRITADSAQATPVQLSVTTENGGNWLSLDTTVASVSQSAPALVTVRGSADGLAEGSYQGAVLLRAGEGARSIPISFTVQRQALQLAPSALTFTVGEGGPVSPSQQVRVVNTGRESFSWTATASAQWITLDRTTGAVDGALGVSVNPAGLAAGEYFGEVRVTPPPGAAVQWMTVRVVVVPAGTVPPVTLSTGGLLVGTGGLELALTNPYTVAFPYFVSRDFGDVFQWFNVNPPTASLEPGLSRTLAFDLRPNIAPGVRRGVLSLAFAGGALRQVEVAAIDGGASCRPSRLVTVLGTPAMDEPLVTGQPVAVEATVADDCGVPVSSGAVTLLTPDGGVPLLPQASGRWVGTWRPAGGALLGPWELTLVARSGNLAGSSDRTVTVSESALPVVSAVVTGGTFSRYRAVAPGSFVTVLGAGLADATVAIHGSPAQTVFSNANQVNAILPAGLAGGQLHSLVVRRGSAVSVPELVPVASVSPDVFVIAQPGGRVQGAVTDPQFRLVDLANPAAAGDVVVIFCTGLGAATAPVTVSVAGVMAPVIGVAPAPGFPGLYQVATRLGQLTPALGDALLTVTAGGLTSPAVPIATR